MTNLDETLLYALRTPVDMNVRFADENLRDTFLVEFLIEATANQFREKGYGNERVRIFGNTETELLALLDEQPNRVIVNVLTSEGLIDGAVEVFQRLHRLGVTFIRFEVDGEEVIPLSFLPENVTPSELTFTNSESRVIFEADYA